MSLYKARIEGFGGVLTWNYSEFDSEIFALQVARGIVHERISRLVTLRGWRQRFKPLAPTRLRLFGDSMITLPQEMLKCSHSGTRPGESPTHRHCVRNCSAVRERIHWSGICVRGLSAGASQGCRAIITAAATAWMLTECAQAGSRLTSLQKESKTCSEQTIRCLRRAASMRLR